MFSKLIVIAAFLLGALVGAGGLYLSAPSLLAKAPPAANPLLSANRAELMRLVPFYFQPCGKILFEGAPAAARQIVENCVDQVKTNVWFNHQIKLSEADVLDPQVKAHWLSVMKSTP